MRNQGDLGVGVLVALPKRLLAEMPLKLSSAKVDWRKKALLQPGTVVAFLAYSPIPDQGLTLAAQSRRLLHKVPQALNRARLLPTPGDDNRVMLRMLGGHSE